MAEYGLNRWWRMVGGMAMNMALGTLYGWSVFVTPLEREFGWNRAQISMTFTIGLVTFAAMFLVFGKLQDRIGPRPVAIAAAVLIGLGYLMCARTESLGWIYFWFGIVVGLAIGCGYASAVPVTAKWFPDKRGLAIGISTAAFGAGSAIFGPLAELVLIPRYGWRSTFTILGAIFFALAAFGAALMKNPPAGWRPVARANAPAPKHHSQDLSAGEVIRSRTFWFMWLAYATGSSAGLMVISQLSPWAKQSLASTYPGNAALIATLATVTFVISALGNAAGRTVSGAISDKMGRLTVLRLTLFAAVIVFPLLNIAGASAVMLYLVVFAVYWTYGTQLSLNASTAADFWGTKNAGVNYGMLYTAWGVGGVLGPKIGASLYLRNGDYSTAFIAAAVLSAVAFLFELLAKDPRAAVHKAAV